MLLECPNCRVCPNRPGCARAFQNQGSLLTPEPHTVHGAHFPSPDISPKALKKGVNAPECCHDHNNKKKSQEITLNNLGRHKNSVWISQQNVLLNFVSRHEQPLGQNRGGATALPGILCCVPGRPSLGDLLEELMSWSYWWAKKVAVLAETKLSMVNYHDSLAWFISVVALCSFLIGTTWGFESLLRFQRFG